jgi:ribosomal protein S18 acetylase RimI-like enzyme
MSVTPTVHFREAIPQEDALIAQHFYQLWRDNDVSAESIRSDWLEVILDFISRARRELYYKAFVAETGGKVIGSTSCQLFTGLYPHVFAEHYRKYGYVWGVYVDVHFRGQGIAKQLTSMAVDHLRILNCTRVILHASPSGKPVYERLGFSTTNEMRLDI